MYPLFLRQNNNIIIITIIYLYITAGHAVWQWTQNVGNVLNQINSIQWGLSKPEFHPKAEQLQVL